jgi:hypothetical protein
MPQLTAGRGGVRNRALKMKANKKLQPTRRMREVNKTTQAKIWASGDSRQKQQVTEH